MIARRMLVAGTVQGVGYRDWTARTASELAIVGWVRNLIDGRVEIWAEGTGEALDQLEQRAWRGPRHAHVVQITKDNVTPMGHVGFARRPTAAVGAP